METTANTASDLAVGNEVRLRWQTTGFCADFKSLSRLAGVALNFLAANLDQISALRFEIDPLKFQLGPAIKAVEKLVDEQELRRDWGQQVLNNVLSAKLQGESSTFDEIAALMTGPPRRTRQVLNITT